MPDHQLDVATATNYGLNILCHDTSLPGAADLHLVNLDILLAGMDKYYCRIDAPQDDSLLQCFRQRVHIVGIARH
jgi:hypothetical protein